MASDQHSQLQQILFDDIERRSVTEAEFRRTRILINDTASAIANTLRNDLTVVSGNVELIGMKPVPDAVHRFARNAQLAATSANRILQRISLLDRIGKGNRSELDVHGELVSLRAQVEHEMRSNVQVVWNLSPSRCSLKGDSEEFRTVIHELLRNALEAMPGGGTLSITNSEQKLRPEPDQDSIWWLVVEICDTGTGMPKARGSTALAPVSRVNDQARLALGLCLLDRYVSELEGVVSINSAEARGTEVTLLIPLDTPCQGSLSGTGSM